MSKLLILDGGLGTTLEQNHGVKFSPAQPLWSSSLLITDPSTLIDCQASFTRIPVDILLTATYQLSIGGFANTKTEERPNGYAKNEIPAYADAAVDIAHKAVEKGPGDTGIALSVGPYGACMVPSQEYSGRYDEAHDSLASLEEWHRERLALMNGPGSAQRVRFIALETIPRVDEIRAMRTALSSTTSLSSVPYWVSCLFPDQTSTALPDGTPAFEAVRAMLDTGVPGDRPWGIGINCTKVHRLEPLLREYERAVAETLGDEEWPALVLYPDGTNGEVYNTTTKTWEVPENGTTEDGGSGLAWEEVLARAVDGTQTRGKWPTIVVGGCCMASPDHIKRLRARLLS